MLALKFKPGDAVWVSGRCYQSANGTLFHGDIEKQKGEIKKVAPKGSHPYAIKGIDGWFNAESVKKYVMPTVKIGDKAVLIKRETYDLIPIKLPINTVYEIIDIDESKAYISYKQYLFTVNIYSLKKV